MRLPNMLLHIDDDHAFTRIVAERLRKAGVESHSLNDPSLWRETVLKLDAGIVLLDIDLASVNGLDLIEKIRKLDGDRRVIMLSQMMHVSSLVSSLEQGADYYFFKSEYDFNELVGAIHAIQFQRFHWCRAARVASDVGRAYKEAGLNHEQASASKGKQPLKMMPAVTDSKISFLSEAFPRFLLDTCQVPLDTLMKAVEYSDRQRPLLGQIALEAGKLNMRQIFQIVEDQVVSREPFGKIAVRLKMLGPDDVEALLEMQKERRPDIGASLVSIGAMTSEQLQRFQLEFQLHIRQKSLMSRDERHPTLSTSA